MQKKGRETVTVFDLLLLPETTLWAWRKVKNCYQSADSLFDQAAVAAFELNLEQELESIRSDFGGGRWRNQPLRPVPQPKKPKPTGEPRLRQYFEVSVRDQVAWAALVTVLGPEVDRQMPAWSYGNRLYRSSWYELETPEGSSSKLNVGPYRHSRGNLYRHFKHSWPLYRRHISLAARQMVQGELGPEHLDEGELRALEQREGLSYLEPWFWRRAKSQGETIYAASLDLAKFYPSIKPEAILKGFEASVEGFQSEAPLVSLIQDMLQFEVDAEGLSETLRKAIDPTVTTGPFSGIPTGIFVGGFLANVAMLPIDKIVDALIHERGRIAHFRFVDDHEVLAYDFDELVAWIAEYKALLNGSGIGVSIEPEKFIPEELKRLFVDEVEIDENTAPDMAEARATAMRLAQLNGRKPTALMTRTLAQVSMLAATDFDLLTDAGRAQRLEQLEWLLLANVPEQEIRQDTRMAFAAARISSLTPTLFRPNDDLHQKLRQLAATMEVVTKSRSAGLPVSAQMKQQISGLKAEVRHFTGIEGSAWNKLLRRHFGLLFEAFSNHPDKARLFLRLLDYCRMTGYDGLPRITEWMRAHEIDELRFLKCYLGSLGIHAIARHIATACMAVNRTNLLHRERNAARSFLSHLTKFDINAFFVDGRSTKLERFQIDAMNALLAACVLGAIELNEKDRSLANGLTKCVRKLLGSTPTVAALGELTKTSVGVWCHWFFGATGSYSDRAPLYWGELAQAHDPYDQYDWASLRRYPDRLPMNAWERLRDVPNLIASDDEGWLLDAARAEPLLFYTLSAEHPSVASVRSMLDQPDHSMTLSNWVAFVASTSPNDPRRSEWTALEIIRQILMPLHDLFGPDPDYLDRLHPENIRIPVSWRDISADYRVNQRITWEGWRLVASRESVIISQISIADFRYSDTLAARERRWERRLRPLGQLLWGILRLDFDLPRAWNIRGQERSFVGIITKDLERLPISSFTLAILQSCLLPRSIETLFLPKYPSLFGNAKMQAAADIEFEMPIRGPDELERALVRAQSQLQRNQMTVLEHEPRQLIPVELQQVAAFVGGPEGQEDLQQ